MMRRALELAGRGAGQVSPGPLVGCVIATDDGRIVGEGFYLYLGVKHAEPLALEQAGELARGATAYVSLEPHAHQGRTPPCSEALIKAGIKRVVASIEDPNPLVSGKGFSQLREASIEVSVGLLAHEASRMNEKYIHFIKEARPFVHLKLAASLDGRIATRTGDSRWITGDEARGRVHKLRHEYDAILIGAGTALADDPLLTDRSGRTRHRPLTRVVLDNKLRLSPSSKLAQTTSDAPVLVFTSAGADEARASALLACGVEIIRHENQERGFQEIMKELARRSIQSVLVEGGATVAGALLDAKLVDKISFFIAPLIIGGRDAPAAIIGNGAEFIKDAVNLRDVEITQHGRDLEITGYPKAVTSDD
ncbi:MAG TPA: bifunctional diaminohydroxyphosphoribosylaminopyrimidine deaminase/5-amino-6-(5-phosphoribosylamino)uracil reductase RibD [Pyrinomonadaceae bacterium]